ncbi:Amidase [Purpureocillium takamizusanense]|uniref:Amidase n=1 Tax=Purpureocillium takamizusanense TaxID=2060973 RepID=A0A9Q8QCW9_9HYPO|nr:Amidase [Purpureocillium takamizusanense]UNI16477.1 Amidase [Purpureocillium takamizusanense]
MLHESQLPRSCDRCHALKERCQRLPGASKCDRCDRLQLPCQSNRPVKRPGRRPRPYHHLRTTSKPAVSSTPASTSTDSLPTPPAEDRDKEKWHSLCSSLTRLADSPPIDDDVHVMQRILSDDFLQQFVLPSFCDAHRESLVSQFFAARSIVKDAYVACAISMPGPGEDVSVPLDDMRLASSYRRATAALAILRTIKVKGEHDVPLCLALGAALLTFALRMGGFNAHAICSNVLGMAKDLYEANHGAIPVDLGFLTCLVLTDTSECLLRGGVPTLKLRPAPGVDRYIGLCQTLMPHYYDLCVLSNEMAQRRGDDALGKLCALERSISNWLPDIPDDFVNSYSATEISRMACQATVLQTAALLVIHRLRHPFGTEEDAARAMSSNVLKQLDVTRIITGQTPRSIDLALTVACLEVEDAAERWDHLRNASSIGVYSGMFSKRVADWMTMIWEARQIHSPLYWYDLGAISRAPS